MQISNESKWPVWRPGVRRTKDEKRETHPVFQRTDRNRAR